MNAEEFVTALFGEGWKSDQLPVFLFMVKQAQEDARRYYEIRDHLSSRSGTFITSRKDLDGIDDLADAARYCGTV